MRVNCGKSGRGKSEGMTVQARPHLIALSDPSRAPDPFLLARALPPGAWLIWRAYGQAPSRDEVTRLTRLVHARKGQLLIAGTGQLAGHMARLSDGIHLPAHRLKGAYTEQFRQRPRARFQITAAAHGERDIIAAARAGVDVVLVSPVFATASHPGVCPLGVTRFAYLATRARALGLGVCALGGVTDKTRMRRLRGSHPAGFAGIGFFSPQTQA